MENRALDALVADKVMGKFVDVGAGMMGHCEDSQCCESEPIPAYSTDIAAAWEVVEKLRADGFWFSLKQDSADIWDAKVWKGDAKGWFPTVEYYASAETAAHAFSLVALKAVGVKVPA